MRWFGRRREQEQDLREELASHLAIEQAQLRQQGLSAPDAERAARRALGNLAQVHEDTRETWGFTALEQVAQDAAFGLRLLRRTPLWTTVVCLTLALGIGLSAAIFSVVHAVLLAPLPYAEPERVVAFHLNERGKRDQRLFPSPALWQAWRERLTTVRDVSLTRMVANFNLTGDGPPERLNGARTTADVPQTLGVPPLHGRIFTDAEVQADAPVALLSHALWRRRFGASPAIVGRKIQLNGKPHEVVGVMPRDYRHPDATFEIWTPLHMPRVIHGADYGYLVLARLKPHVTVAAAQADLQRVMAQLGREHLEPYRHLEFTVGPLAAVYAAQVRPALLMLCAAAGGLLALGCLNLAVLLFARASARSRELQTRLALGASAARLRRQLLAEAVPLGLAGVTLGVTLAAALMRAMLPLLPPNFPRLHEAELNLPVLTFALAVSMAVVLAASLAPSFSSVALPLSSRGTTRRARRRDLLVAAQVAIAVVLVFGSLLTARSFTKLLAVQPGFQSEGVLTMHLAVARTQFSTDPEIAAYYDRLADRIAAIPGVVAAGFTNRLPLSGNAQTGSVEFENIEGRWHSDWRSVTSGYFGAMGIPLVDGRSFSQADRPDGMRVGIIDANLAKKIFGHASPLGRRFRRAGPPGALTNEPWSTIVGVAGHILNDSLESDLRPQVYWPETQRAQDRAALAVRTAGDPATYTPAVTRAIRAENPQQPVYDVRPMTGWVQTSLRLRTLATGLVTLFSLASLILACLGLYGVMSYATSLRQREFGIRLALGATGRQVQALVFRHGGAMVATGLLAGLAVCWPAGGLVQTFLYGIERLDLASWLLAPVCLILVGLLAALGPAQRAAKADPAETLRAD